MMIQARDVLRVFTTYAFTRTTPCFISTLFFILNAKFCTPRFDGNSADNLFTLTFSVLGFAKLCVKKVQGRPANKIKTGSNIQASDNLN